MTDANRAITLLRGLDHRTDARIDTGHLPTDHRVLRAVLDHGHEPVIRDYLRGVLGDVPTVEHLIWKAWDLDRYAGMTPRLGRCGVECETPWSSEDVWLFNDSVYLMTPFYTVQPWACIRPEHAGMWAVYGAWEALCAAYHMDDTFPLWWHLAGWARKHGKRVAEVGR